MKNLIRRFIGLPKCDKGGRCDYKKVIDGKYVWVESWNMMGYETSRTFCSKCGKENTKITSL